MVWKRLYFLVTEMYLITYWQALFLINPGRLFVLRIYGAYFRRNEPAQRYSNVLLPEQSWGSFLLGVFPVSTRTLLISLVTNQHCSRSTTSACLAMVATSDLPATANPQSRGLWTKALRNLAQRKSKRGLVDTTLPSPVQGDDADEDGSRGFRLLHQLPAEIRLRVLEFVIRAAAPTGCLTHVRHDVPCKCRWFYGRIKLYRYLITKNRQSDPEPCFKDWLISAPTLFLLPLVVLPAWAEDHTLSVSYFHAVRKSQIPPARPAKLPLLSVDRLIRQEAQCMIYQINRIVLTSREALELLEAPEILDMVKQLKIVERKPSESIFLHKAGVRSQSAFLHKAGVRRRQRLLLGIQRGKQLRELTIDIQLFFGQRTRSRLQGVEYFLDATGIAHCVAWRCVALGSYTLQGPRECVGSRCDDGLGGADDRDPSRGPCIDDSAWSPHTLSPSGGPLCRIRLEHTSLAKQWKKVASIGNDMTNEWARAHESRKYYSCDYLFPKEVEDDEVLHRCDRARAATQAFLCWVKRNVTYAMEGKAKPAFHAHYLDWGAGLLSEEVDLMPGHSEQLLEHWTRKLARGIARVWDDRMF